MCARGENQGDAAGPRRMTSARRREPDPERRQRVGDLRRARIRRGRWGPRVEDERRADLADGPADVVRKLDATRARSQVTRKLVARVHRRARVAELVDDDLAAL